MRVNLLAALSVDVSIDVVDCAACGVVFGMASDFHRRMKNSGATFYCPAGHQNVYGDSAADLARKKLEGELAAERARASRLSARVTAAEDQARAAERERKKSRKELSAALQRIHGGVCPHCNRTFKVAAMLRHFETRHPDLIAAARAVDRG